MLIGTAFMLLAAPFLRIAEALSPKDFSLVDEVPKLPYHTDWLGGSPAPWEHQPPHP